MQDEINPNKILSKQCVLEDRKRALRTKLVFLQISLDISNCLVIGGQLLLKSFLEATSLGTEDRKATY